jgi:hypothetical protein
MYVDTQLSEDAARRVSRPSASLRQDRERALAWR